MSFFYSVTLAEVGKLPKHDHQNYCKITKLCAIVSKDYKFIHFFYKRCIMRQVIEKAISFSNYFLYHEGG